MGSLVHDIIYVEKYTLEIAHEKIYEDRNRPVMCGIVSMRHRIFLFSSSFLLTYVLHFWGTALTSQALRASSPKGGSQKPLPLGEVALRSNDGEGEAVSHKRKGSRLSKDEIP